MDQKLSLDELHDKTSEAIAHLKEVDKFLRYLDGLDTFDLKDWDYLVERMFTEERNALFDLITVLEGELLPEIEERGELA